MRPWLAAFPEHLRAAERWLLPGECLVCQQPAGEADDPLICQVCRSRWRRLPMPQCARCGQPVDRDSDCRICLEWPEGFHGVASAVWLDASARRAVHLLKYDGWRRVADAMGTAMTGLGPLGPSVSLVPIPLSAARRKSRGYNQSAEIARGLGRWRGLRVVDALQRTRDTRTQTLLTPEEREANLRSAFVAPGVVPALPVLVDDVFTTGATLRSAAEALLRAGADRVGAVTFARAELPLAAIGRTV